MRAVRLRLGRTLFCDSSRRRDRRHGEETPLESDGEGGGLILESERALSARERRANETFRFRFCTVLRRENRQTLLCKSRLRKDSCT